MYNVTYTRHLSGNEVVLKHRGTSQYEWLRKRAKWLPHAVAHVRLGLILLGGRQVPNNTKLHVARYVHRYGSCYV